MMQLLQVYLQELSPLTVTDRSDISKRERLMYAMVVCLFMVLLFSISLWFILRIIHIGYRQKNFRRSGFPSFFPTPDSRNCPQLHYGCHKLPRHGQCTHIDPHGESWSISIHIDQMGRCCACLLEIMEGPARCPRRSNHLSSKRITFRIVLRCRRMFRESIGCIISKSMDVSSMRATICRAGKSISICAFQKTSTHQACSFSCVLSSYEPSFIFNSS